MDAKLKQAVDLHNRGEAAQAASLYIEILAANPRHTDALHLLGVTEAQLGRADSALRWIAKSLAINPDQPAAIANQGNALLSLGKAAEALASYDSVLRVWPQYLLAVFGRGNALAALDRPLEALSSYDRALELAPNFVAALCARGAVLMGQNRYEDALAAYERAKELSAGQASVHLGRGLALLGMKAYDEAARSIDRALELAPNFTDALVARGHLFAELGRTDLAIAAYDRALEQNPGLAAAWFSRGVHLSQLARFAEAAPSFRRALEIDSRHPFARGASLHAQLQICDWTGYYSEVREIAASVERGDPVDFPFSFLAVCDSPRLQLQCSRQFADSQRRQQPLWTGERYAHDRIRVAYVSADFVEHPIAYLMAGLFEHHDRERFETIAVSLRHDPRSATTQRVKAAFERFVEAGSRSDLELARLIRELEVDIAVDLMGYTGAHRAGIFAHRPAPIQVGYLGFPATMGTRHIDYLIADDFLIPEGGRTDYSERIIFLPDCFQANDDRKFIAPDRPSRSDMALPESGFVWGAFHSHYKLNPPLFDIWAGLLRAVAGSVLWVVGGNPVVEKNLRRELAARGVDPWRLVLAQPLPYAKHLARLSLADLCLDTLPFNGGATTSDALWAGVPMVSCAGKSYAARMSGSLLRACGVPELATDSLEAYEALALRLARDPERLADLRARLVHNRGSTPLFDTDRFRRHLEAAYIAVVEQHRRGARAASVRLPDFSGSDFESGSAR